ncbi:hypothetical protein DQ04_17401020, partial [Trypanosoma grayi]|uniref:hypothetical protein n=1 Tax=Trypanosoma grayi TaxID=71804 RepID=UPI0004F4557A
TRKAVRCLQRRQATRQHAPDGVPASYGLTWLQLSETVVRGDEQPEENGEGRRSWEELQLERVDETNRRVLQVVRAAPPNSLIIVLAAGAQSLSSLPASGRPRGVCFAFVKDDKAPGPPTAWLDGEATASTATTAQATARRVDGVPATPPVCEPQ